jgi:cell shape-determining protein MreC
MSERNASKFSTAQLLTIEKNQHKKLNRKVARETRKLQKLAELRNENDRLRMDLIELAQGSQPVIDSDTRERTYYKAKSIIKDYK